MDQSLSALTITLVLGIFMLIGCLIAFAVDKKETFMDFSLALAFSVILMLIFTDLLPEVSAILGLKNFLLFLVCLIGGFVLLRVLDNFVPDHDHEEEHHHKENKKELKDNLVHIGVVSSIALVIHNIIEGMAVYNTAISSMNSGILLSIGIGLHNIPLGMIITGALYQGNKSKKKTVITICLLALSTFVGGLIMFFTNGQAINETLEGALLSITIGMLAFISMSELFPRIKKNKNKKITWIGLTTGVILILISMFL